MTAWNLFPYPTHTSDGLNDGCLVDAPRVCQDCRKKPCTTDLAAKRREFKTCPYGINYARLDDDTLTLGLVITDFPIRSKQARRRARQEPESHVKTADLRKVLESVSNVDRGVLVDFERDRATHLEVALRSPEVINSITRELRSELSSNLNQSHDFLQLSAIIRGYATTLLEEKFPGVDVVAAAESAPVEGAIYFATELMRGKIDATLYLNEPNRAFGEERHFEVHRFITKYYRIYRWQSVQKDLALTMTGKCFVTVNYRPEAIGAVVQALLDNMVKYAPAGTSGRIEFDEKSTGVDIAFISLGPKIQQDETALIFTPGYRSEAARRLEPTGLGLGLAAAKQVSNMLDLQLAGDQASTPSKEHPNHYETRFSLRMAASKSTGEP